MQINKTKPKKNLQLPTLIVMDSFPADTSTEVRNRSSGARGSAVDVRGSPAVPSAVVCDLPSAAGVSAPRVLARAD